MSMLDVAARRDNVVHPFVMANVIPIRRAIGEKAGELLGANGFGGHLVHFYEDERVLFDVVGRFLAEGLAAGEKAIVIATPEHACGIAPHLASVGIEDAIAGGRLLLLDARETLDRLLVGGTVDPVRFGAVLSEAFDRLTGGESCVRVRAFGEMVDLLWRGGQRRSALQLEEMWNAAARDRPVSLLCGFAMTSFYETEDTGGERFADICGTHSHVLPPESFVQVERSDEPLVEISRLSDAARLVAAERRFRLLVGSVSDYAVFMLDPGGRVSTWNAGAERIKGWRADEILGQHFSVLYPPEDAAAGKCERALATAAAEGRFADEGWRVRKDGSRFWANVVITALRESGKLVGFAKVTRDTTDRRRAAEGRVRELRAPISAMQELVQQIGARGGHSNESELRMLARELHRMSRLVDALGQDAPMPGPIV